MPTTSYRFTSQPAFQREYTDILDEIAGYTAEQIYNGRNRKEILPVIW